MSSVENLAKELRAVYDRPPSGKKTVEIHLFGIRHADALAMVSVPAVVTAAGISDNYATEINKGRALAPFVSLKR